MFKGKSGVIGMALFMLCAFGLVLPESVKAVDCNFTGELNADNVECVCDAKMLYVTCNDIKIESIAKGTFDKYDDVTIENTSIKYLPDGVFSKETSVIKILGNKNLTTINEKAFEGLDALTNLTISDNVISILSVGVFSGLDSLTKINMSNNKLTNLPVGIFDGLLSLNTLAIDVNKLMYLSEDLFKTQGSALKVTATYNCLNTGNTDYFDGIVSSNSQFDNQRVCLVPVYDYPKTAEGVKHPVVARVGLTGNAELIQDTYSPILSKIPSQIFLQNGTTGFDVSLLSDHISAGSDEGIANYPDNNIITGNVEWIIPNVVTFHTNGGSDIELEGYNTNERIGYYDDEINGGKEPQTEKTGYTFSGWFGDGTEFAKRFIFSGHKIGNVEGIEFGTEYENADIDLYVKWQANTYQFYVDLNGGTCKENCRTSTGILFDDKIPLLPTVERIGYTFGYYYTGNDINNIITGEVTKYTWPENSTGTVYWLPNKYSINLNPDGGVIDGANSLDATYDQPLTLPTPTREGYDFLGWMDVDSGNAIVETGRFVDGYDIDTGLNLKAAWTPHEYTMTFDYGDGTGTEPSRQIEYLSGLGDLPNANRPGYTLSGWKVDSESITGTGVYKWTENVTAKADWTANKYKIFIDLNGGTWTYDTKFIEVTFGEPIGEGKLPTAENASKTGYTFGGVSNIELGEDYTGGTTYDSVGNSTGTVLWIANKYPIILDAKGGKVNNKDQDSITGTYNAEVKLPTPLYTGHNFQGWYSGDQKFETPFTYNLTTGLNLVAKRELANYTLTFDTNGGTKINPITTGYGLEIPAITDPTRTGYVFTGWYDAKEGGDKISVPSKMPLNGQTIYAHWDANTYQLSFDFNGGTGDNTPIDVEFDKNIGVLPVATNTGFIFDGWKIGNTFINPGTKYTRPNSSTAIAQWSTPTAGGNNGGRSGGGSHRSSTNTPTNYEGEVDANHSSAGNNDENDEYHIAHQWAYEKGLTSFENFDDARMFEDLTRAEMAKISSIFATKFYDKIPDTSAEKSYACSQYADLADVNEELQGYIIQSCELGYMGYLSNGIDYLTNFRPNDKISRAEVAIVFSRIMWGNEYAGDENHWYEKHLQAMFDQGIIHNISTPFKNEMRGDVFIMLSRVDHVQ